jgi:hypothetical protein
MEDPQKGEADIMHLWFKWLKNQIMRLTSAPLVAAASTLKFILKGDYLRLRRQLEDNERAIRMTTALLLQKYDQVAGPYHCRSMINRHEAKIYSQNGEDGILLYLFSILGTKNRRFVEFGASDGRQCNSANLALNFGWSGLLLEADEQKAAAARYYYQQRLAEEAAQVQVVHCKVTQKNINQVLAGNGLSGEIDLLSIDIDGNDYWLWQAIEVISPSVVVIEYNASLGSADAITIPYDPDFNLRAGHPSGFYHGASLAALTRLARQKGYLLAGCESAGVNAFFVRQDVAEGKIEEISVQAAYYPHERRTARMSPAQQFDEIKHLDFQNV